MIDKTLQLIKRILIANEFDAKSYNLELFFQNLVLELEYYSKGFYANQRIDLSEKANDKFRDYLLKELKYKHIFTDLLGHTINVEDVIITVTNFDALTHVSNVYFDLISEKMRLKGTVGVRLILEKALNIDGALLNIDLDKNHFIHSISA